jgi:hypothetical protein
MPPVRHIDAPRIGDRFAQAWRHLMAAWGDDQSGVLMDFSTLLLGTMLAVLALAGAGLLTAMVLLERPGAELEPALAGEGPAPDRPNKGRRRRGRSGSRGRRA